MLFPPEERTLPHFPGYRITDEGEVLGKRGRALSPRPHRRTRHLRVRLYGPTLPAVAVNVRGKRVERRFADVYVHRLVCEAWHGPPPNEESIVLHLDGDPQNNTPQNLRWGTQQENAEDRERHKLEREIDELQPMTYTPPAPGAEIPF